MILSRVGVDYGADGDARRSAAAALRLAASGDYTPSRLPGNPIFEYLLAAVVPWGGHLAANLFVAASYVVAVIAFHRLACARRHGLLLTVLFALTPALLVNGATTIDYVPGLALLLWSYVTLRDERIWAAALLAGLAIGIRVTNMLFLVPLASFLVLRGAPLREAAVFGAVAMGMGLLPYVPVIESAGARFLAIPPPLEPPAAYALHTGYRFASLFGLPALASLLALAAVYHKRVTATWRGQLRRMSPSFAVEVMTIVIFSGMFLLHSDERDYLLPIVPFVFLHVDRWLPGRRVSMVLACVVMPAVLTVDPRPGASLIRAGLIQADIQKRTEMGHLRASVACFNLADKAVILTRQGPALTHENPALEPVPLDQLPFAPSRQGVEEPENIHRLRGRDVYFVYDLSPENRQRALLAGYSVFSLFRRSPGEDAQAALAEPTSPDALCRGPSDAS